MHVVLISLKAGTNRASIKDRNSRPLKSGFLEVSIFAARMRLTYRERDSKKRQNSTVPTQTACNIEVVYSVLYSV
jgi:hypothetical protein